MTLSGLCFRISSKNLSLQFSCSQFWLVLFPENMSCAVCDVRLRGLLKIIASALGKNCSKFSPTSMAVSIPIDVIPVTPSRHGLSEWSQRSACLISATTLPCAQCVERLKASTLFLSEMWLRIMDGFENDVLILNNKIKKIIGMVQNLMNFTTSDIHFVKYLNSNFIWLSIMSAKK